MSLLRIHWIKIDINNKNIKIFLHIGTKLLHRDHAPACTISYPDILMVGDFYLRKKCNFRFGSEYQKVRY